MDQREQTFETSVLPAKPWVHSAFPFTRAAARTEVDGLLLIDKPCGCTSFDVIRRLKYVFGFSKIGHAGTLDPLATGLLLIVLGKATKASQALMCGEKTYEGVLHLGVETDTYDREGAVVATQPVEGIDEKQIQKTFQTFVGDQYQQPPIFSAKKVKGVPCYRLARKGQPVERKPNFITIFQCDLLRYEVPRVSFRIHCSKGTYVRSFAHEVGVRLGCGGHLAALRRTQSGSFSLSQAIALDTLLQNPSLLPQVLLPFDSIS